MPEGSADIPWGDGNSPPKKANSKKGPAKLRVGAVLCSEGSCGDLGVSTFPAVRFYKNDAEPADFGSFFDREDTRWFVECCIKEVIRNKT